MPVTSIMQLLHAFFSARGNIVRIDSCTDDSIRISLTVAIRLIGAPVNRYTPKYNEMGLHWPSKNGSPTILNQFLTTPNGWYHMNKDTSLKRYLDIHPHFKDIEIISLYFPEVLFCYLINNGDGDNSIMISDLKKFFVHIILQLSRTLDQRLWMFYTLWFLTHRACVMHWCISEWGHHWLR